MHCGGPERFVARFLFDFVGFAQVPGAAYADRLADGRRDCIVIEGEPDGRVLRGFAALGRKHETRRGCEPLAGFLRQGAPVQNVERFAAGRDEGAVGFQRSVLRENAARNAVSLKNSERTRAA